MGRSLPPPRVSNMSPGSLSRTISNTVGLPLRHDKKLRLIAYLEYKINADPSLPLINFSATGAKPSYTLAELCEMVPGQSIKAKLSPGEQDSMIQFACRAPPLNAESITTSGRQLLGLDNNPLLEKFGIKVDKNLVTVRGRELPPPPVVYKKGGLLQSVMPENGGWLMKQVCVFKSGRPINAWTFLHFDTTAHNTIKQTISKFAGFMAQNMGVNINKVPNPPNGYVVKQGNLESIFADLAKNRTQLAIVVLPSRDIQLYNMIKGFGDVRYGIQTICVVQGKIMSDMGQLGYFANVGLKVNLKFGGVNHKLQNDVPLIKGGSTMVVGYDVTHPTNLSPGVSENAPSLVGLVASLDSDLSQWPAQVWAVKGKQEMLDKTLVTAFKNRLILWRTQNQNRLPNNIVIFRDGVSEGQFGQVLEKEMPFIRQACTETYNANVKPRISLIVSVKRHQTRFFPTDPNHIHSRSKSPKEGTIVDRGVTSVKLWDFFLQAHASLQGKLSYRYDTPRWRTLKHVANTTK